MDYVRIKYLNLSEGTTLKVNRQAKEWEEVFTVHILDKGLPPIPSNELLQINNKDKNTIEKWAKGSNQYIKKSSFPKAS